IRLEAVDRPFDAPLYIDSRVTFIPDDAPPPTRTASTVDFRQAAHDPRLAFLHSGRTILSRVDSSASIEATIEDDWRRALP
ncbi:MAG: hypothetical protein KDA28_05525, partial [Phycisphaerales bacterium]|nr:hypothetical protein [Phycisphaerales bacterium]